MSHAASERDRSNRSPGPGRRWVLPIVVVLLWLFVGGPLGSFAGRLSEVQQNDNAAFLPESTDWGTRPSITSTYDTYVNDEGEIE